MCVPFVIAVIARRAALLSNYEQRVTQANKLRAVEHMLPCTHRVRMWLCVPHPALRHHIHTANLCTYDIRKHTHIQTRAKYCCL
mmetsp:Transcript_2770/g.7608  ORF Transcript_2770/g.7608 Transcript_2770/m.7608 type:complete len:84 (-) Transcript_2770:662-913(-)